MQALGVEATTGHWEFTLGAERVTELFGGVDKPGSSGLTFLAGNVRDTDFEEPVFPSTRLFEKGGVAVAVIGQAFPYTPIANPRWMMPNWSFGIRERTLRVSVAEARRQGAQVVVLLSHNGFDVDRKLADAGRGHRCHPDCAHARRAAGAGAGGAHAARRLRLVGQAHLAPRPGGRPTAASPTSPTRLIPVLADAITPDPAMAALIARIRAPHEAMLATELARTDGLLYRRDTFVGTLDQLICDAVHG